MFQDRVLLLSPIGPAEISGNCHIRNGVNLFRIQTCPYFWGSLHLVYIHNHVCVCVSTDAPILRIANIAHDYSYYLIFNVSIQIEPCFLFPFHIVDYHLPKTRLNFPYLWLSTARCPWSGKGLSGGMFSDFNVPWRSFHCSKMWASIVLATTSLALSGNVFVASTV